MIALLSIARAYVDAGLSVIPILADASKKPSIKWTEYQKRQPTKAELHLWFGRPGIGLAIICGAVSGNLEVLDFDDAKAFEDWSYFLREESPGILDRLPQVRTPSGGMHVYYRCEVIGRNTKLAHPREGKKALVETRGEGGYVLAPGCPPECHLTGKLYRHVAGPKLTSLADLHEVSV